MLNLGRMKGIEPSTFGTTTRRSNQMSYIRHIVNLVRAARIELASHAWKARILAIIRRPRFKGLYHFLLLTTRGVVLSRR